MHFLKTFTIYFESIAYCLTKFIKIFISETMKQIRETIFKLLVILPPLEDLVNRILLEVYPLKVSIMQHSLRNCNNKNCNLQSNTQ